MIELNVPKHEVKYQVGKIVKHAHLTPKEFDMLRMLAEAKGALVTREKIMAEVWGHDKDLHIDTRTVDQHMARLRKKLGAAAACIHTVTAHGYKATAVTMVGLTPPLQMRVLAAVHGVDKAGKTWTEARVRFETVQAKVRKGDVLQVAA
jgi:DNA-binding CsgD family transcriptional regulator